MQIVDFSVIFIEYFSLAGWITTHWEVKLGDEFDEWIDFIIFKHMSISC